MAYNTSNGMMNDDDCDNKSTESPERKSEPDLQNVRTNQEGEVIDPYGGKKLGMVRVSISNSISTTTERSIDDVNPRRP
jgi:hypothetical protein